MEKSTFTPLYEHFRGRLVELRKGAGLTQRELAKKLGREHSFVSRIEQGERRLDVVEYFWVVQACGKDPVKVASALMREFLRLGGSRDPDRPSRRSRRR